MEEQNSNAEPFKRWRITQRRRLFHQVVHIHETRSCERESINVQLDTPCLCLALSKDYVILPLEMLCFAIRLRLASICLLRVALLFVAVAM